MNNSESCFNLTGDIFNKRQKNISGKFKGVIPPIQSKNSPIKRLRDSMNSEDQHNINFSKRASKSTGIIIDKFINKKTCNSTLINTEEPSKPDNNNNTSISNKNKYGHGLSLTSLREIKFPELHSQSKIANASNVESDVNTFDPKKSFQNHINSRRSFIAQHLSSRANKPVI